MITLEDALRLVTDREYMADLGPQSAPELELQIGRVVAALIHRGAESHYQAHSLTLEAVEHIGGRMNVNDGSSDPRMSARLRIWVPARALRN